MTRVLVCGGRDYRDRGAVYAALDSLHAEHRFSMVIAGGARGADALAADWARDRGIPTEIYMADWEHFGRKAGPFRNGRMLAEASPISSWRFRAARGRRTWWSRLGRLAC
jgi:hypothetical protein